jgi:hypothetical protein
MELEPSTDVGLTVQVRMKQLTKYDNERGSFCVARSIAGTLEIWVILFI